MDRSHSRPHVSNDNPYSEANFKTLKYCPAFPRRFGSIDDAAPSAPCSSTTTTTRHSGLGLHTAASVHYGTAKVRGTACRHPHANPARFRYQRPEPPKLPTVAWINEPTPEARIKSA